MEKRYLYFYLIYHHTLSQHPGLPLFISLRAWLTMYPRGIADLPLHNGRAPRWLFERMVKLSQAISESVIHEYGVEELRKRLTDPFWFQALACTIGFDWHSSGTTTTTCGALKMALDPELHGIAVLGGKGSASLKTPEEIGALGDIFNISSSCLDELLYASRIAAKIDSSCVQDGYRLYHHSFIVTERGNWAVVQQGMNPESRYARRYHWNGNTYGDYVKEPHTGICCDHLGKNILDMTSELSDGSRKISIDLINDGPRHLRRYFAKKGQTDLFSFQENGISMPPRHHIIDMDISERGWDILNRAYELQPKNFEELVSLKGMGPSKIRALALVSDLIYGAEPSWKDPVKYSFSHGGKDGIPYPVDREAYDSTISFLKESIGSAELGEKERLETLKRLSKISAI